MSAPTPFNARLISTWSSDRLYRVYPTNDGISFIRVGGQGGAAQAAAAQFGLLGGLVLGLFAGRSANRLAEKVREADSQDPHALLGRHKHDFQVRMIEVESSVLGRAARIGGHGPHVGRWSLSVRGEKPMTLQLETVGDMQAAARALPEAVSGLHRNDVVWSPQSRKFVSQLT